jgi:hypothetical protein
MEFCNHHHFSSYDGSVIIYMARVRVTRYIPEKGGVMSYCCVSFCTVMNMLANLFLHSDGREL